MRRFLRQSASLGLALLFGLSLASSAFGWHGCPHHAGQPAGEAGDAATVSTLGDRHHDAGHHQSPRGDACTCLGSCHAGAAPVLGSNPGLAVAADDAARVHSPRPSTRRIRHQRPAYFLPFPHGPPALG